MFLLTQNSGSSAAITGTVTVSKNSTSLTTSVPQSAWINNGLQIAGDSSSTTYTVTAGYGTNWTISPAYAGSSGAVAATATLVLAAQTASITGVFQAPTIQVQFGGTGSFETVQTQGPMWSPVSANMPIVAWLLQCGPVQSIVVQNAGFGTTAHRHPRRRRAAADQALYSALRP